MSEFTFGKEQRLSKEKDIQELFSKGSSFYSYPFKIYHQAQPPESVVHQVLISVPKRNFKRAVDRNLIKRRIREAYRLQPGLLPQKPGIFLAFVYTHKEILLFGELKIKVAQALMRIHKNTK